MKNKENFKVLFFVMLWFAGMGFTGGAFVVSCLKRPPTTEPVETVPPEVQKRRLNKAPHESIIFFATEEYNLMVEKNGLAKKKADRCLRYSDEFWMAEQLTGYPEEFLMGIALHESGCQMDTSGSTGHGLMQITVPKGQLIPNKYRQRVADMLGIGDRSAVDYNDPLHNILLGAVMLSDYECRLLSRAHGLLAYNMGPYGVRIRIAEMGRSVKDPPTLVEMKLTLPYNREIKPRVYVEKVLASVAYIHRTANGQKPVKVEGLLPQDIPGFYPSEDGLRPMPEINIASKK